MSTDLLTRGERASSAPPQAANGRASVPHLTTAPAGLRVAQLLGRMSSIGDVARQTPSDSALRGVVFAVEAGRRVGATDAELQEAFWTSLLDEMGWTPDGIAEIAPAIGLPVPGAANAGAAVGRHLGNLGKMAARALAERGPAGATSFLREACAEVDTSFRRVVANTCEELVGAMVAPRLFDRFLTLEPRPVVVVDDDRIDDIARALRLGVSAETRTWLYRAGLLHDVGRLAVPSAVWERPGPLDWAESEMVRLHAYYTERVLRAVQGLAPAADIAAAAHERLDGSGYARQIPGRSMGMAARVLAAADMACAMSEPRPHRAARTATDIAHEMALEVAAGRIDAAATDAVLASMGVRARVGARQAGGVSPRELDVCRQIARGKTNKEIAEVLGISLRTVQTHVAHIFDKLGVHTRSGIAVWLVEMDDVQ
jgi:DNA-binding CsgD family transcriptional regulator